MRRMWCAGAVLALALTLTGCGSSGTDDSAGTTSAPDRTTTEPPPPSSTTTTTAPTTTTTVDPAVVYGEINAEIQRACDEAVTSGKPAVPVFDDSWSDLSSPAELSATVQRCIDGKLAARRPPTTVAPTQPLVPQTTAPPVDTSTYYENCDAVRAAGAAPLYAGQPGYASHLDRDGDGIACEN